MRTIKANEVFQTPVPEIGVTLDSTPATLYYSADGETWTAWSENITDSNVVISGIPGGLFLKFNVACKVTEKW